MTRLAEAREILEVFGFDKGRSNERSARTLLALAKMDEDSKWANATNPMLGVRAILDWIRDRLGHEVAENTRETYRRKTLHQFRDAGFVSNTKSGSWKRGFWVRSPGGPQIPGQWSESELSRSNPAFTRLGARTAQNWRQVSAPVCGSGTHSTGW